MRAPVRTEWLRTPRRGLFRIARSMLPERRRLGAPLKSRPPLRSVRFDERPIELGPPVPEEPPRAARPPDASEVEREGSDASLRLSELRHLVAARVADERRAVEALAVLRPDAVRRHDRDHVRHRVPLHRTLPRLARIELGLGRLPAEGGG